MVDITQHASPFTEHLGLELISADNGQAQWQLNPKDEHLNRLGVVHGGVCMSVLDSVQASAARTLHDTLDVVTLECKTSFMQAAKGLLIAQARVIHQTPTLAFTEGTIKDSRGKLCMHATATFKFVRSLTPRQSQA